MNVIIRIYRFGKADHGNYEIHSGMYREVVHLGISTLIQLSQAHMVGMFIALAIILVIFAAITLIILHFIPMLDELKSFIVGLAVFAGVFVWLSIYIIR